MIGARIDIVIGYNYNDITKSNDKMAEICYHELTHAAHYNKVGNTWYGNFVQAETNEIQTNYNGTYAPYGRGNTTNSPIISLGEGWAYHMGHFLTNRKYGNLSGIFYEQGNLYSNGNPVGTLNSNLNLLEDFNPKNTNDVFRWIPQGLFYDLYDLRNESGLPVIDQVSNFTNLQFFNALDSDVPDLPSFRQRLLGENGNIQFDQVTSLFLQYGY